MTHNGKVLEIKMFVERGGRKQRLCLFKALKKNWQISISKKEAKNKKKLINKWDKKKFALFISFYLSFSKLKLEFVSSFNQIQ